MKHNKESLAAGTAFEKAKWNKLELESVSATTDMSIDVTCPL